MNRNSAVAWLAWPCVDGLIKKERVIDVFCDPDGPFILLWMMRTTDVTVECSHRRRVATHILENGAGGDLCAKLVRTPALLECLRFSASTGTMVHGSALHSLVQLIVHHAKISTEHVEATNKIVKVEVKRAPSISWELLKARLTIKKTLASMSHGDRKKCLATIPTLAQSIAGFVDTTGYRLLDADTTRHQWEAHVCFCCYSTQTNKTQRLSHTHRLLGPGLNIQSLMMVLCQCVLWLRKLPWNHLNPSIIIWRGVGKFRWTTATRGTALLASHW